MTIIFNDCVDHMTSQAICTTATSSEHGRQADHMDRSAWTRHSKSAGTTLSASSTPCWVKLGESHDHFTVLHQHLSYECHLISHINSQLELFNVLSHTADWNSPSDWSFDVTRLFLGIIATHVAYGRWFWLVRRHFKSVLWLGSLSDWGYSALWLHAFRHHILIN